MDDLAEQRMTALPGGAFWSGKRVFLTGHTGFKGGWLALWLHRLGAVVRGYALPPPTAPNFFTLCGIEDLLAHETGDVRDLAHLAGSLADFGPEIVFHLAAQPLVRASYADPVGNFATNVMGTVNVLEAARQAPGVRAVVIVTSDKVYAESAGGDRHGEGDRLGGHDPYSASKACAELATAAFPIDVPVATVRSGNVIGGGDWAPERLVTDFSAPTPAGHPLAIRQPNSIRPWQHVLEPLAGYLAAAEFLANQQPPEKKSWNFGPAAESEITVLDLARRLAASWGTETACDIIDADPALREAPVLRLNSAKAERELGWRPRWDIDQALAATTDWFRALATAQHMRTISLAQIAAYER